MDYSMYAHKPRKDKLVWKVGVHLGPSHAYITRSDSPGFEPATFCALGVRFTRRTGKKWISLSGFSPLSSNHDIATPPLTLPGPQSGSETNVEGEG
jgi:hypothetical protein